MLVVRRGWGPRATVALLAALIATVGAGWFHDAGLKARGYDAVGIAAVHIPVTLTRLTLFFLRVGSVLFGSGYVLIAFLRADLVQRWGWLTEQQLLDAITVGQITPGPVFTTATFIGYTLGGWPGASLATAAIFAPGFLFVAITHPFIPRLRRSPTASALLDGVTLGSLGLMTAVALQLTRAAVVDLPSAAIGLAGVTIVIVLRPNSTWLVIGGAG